MVRRLFASAFSVSAVNFYYLCLICVYTCPCGRCKGQCPNDSYSIAAELNATALVSEFAGVRMPTNNRFNAARYALADATIISVSAPCPPNVRKSLSSA